MTKLGNPAPLARTPGLPLTERCPAPMCFGTLQARHTVTLSLSTVGQQREPGMICLNGSNLFGLPFHHYSILISTHHPWITPFFHHESHFL